MSNVRGENLVYMGPRSTPDLTGKEGMFVKPGTTALSLVAPAADTDRVNGVVVDGRTAKAGSSIVSLKDSGLVVVRAIAAIAVNVEVAPDVTAVSAADPLGPGRGKTAATGDTVVGNARTAASAKDDFFLMEPVTSAYAKA